MTLSLMSIVKDEAINKWFHYGEGEFGTYILIENAGHEQEPNPEVADLRVFSLLIRYMSQDKIRDISNKAIRGAVSKRGRTTRTTNDEWSSAQIIANSQLRGWYMTGDGLMALQGEFKYDEIKDMRASIPYTKDNLVAMITRSGLPAYVTATLSDHLIWFGTTEEEVEMEGRGNSGSGPNSNTAE